MAEATLLISKNDELLIIISKYLIINTQLLNSDILTISSSGFVNLKQIISAIFMMVIDEVFKLKIWCAEESPSEVLDEFSGIFIKSLLSMKILKYHARRRLMMIDVDVDDDDDEWGNDHADSLINHHANRFISF